MSSIKVMRQQQQNVILNKKKKKKKQQKTEESAVLLKKGWFWSKWKWNAEVNMKCSVRYQYSMCSSAVYVKENVTHACLV